MLTEMLEQVSQMKEGWRVRVGHHDWYTVKRKLADGCLRLSLDEAPDLEMLSTPYQLARNAEEVRPIERRAIE